MPRLVCCVDDSDGARAALPVASRLADMLGLELLVLHVAPSTELPGVSAAAGGQARLRDAELADARLLLGELGREVGLDAGTTLHAEIGDPAERILAACADESSSSSCSGRTAGAESKLCYSAASPGTSRPGLPARA